MTTKLERITWFRPAFDKRHDDPKKNFGIGPVSCGMVVKGPKGAVHFTFGTGMYLPETLERLADEGKLVHKMEHRTMVMNEPMGYDVGYHSLEARWENQEVNWPRKMVRKDPNMKEPGPDATQDERLAYINNVDFEKIGDTPPNCEWLGVPCYCDGSALRAEEWMKILLKEGSDTIWQMLETEYKELFEK